MDPKIKHYTDLYPEGNFIDAERMRDRKPTLKVRTITREKLAPQEEGGEPKVNSLMYFDGTHKCLSLCKTNIQCLVAMFGPAPPEWIGRRVTLFAGKWKGKPAPRIWGSPEIDHDFEVMIVLKNKNGGSQTSRMTMHRTQNGGAKPITRTEPEPPLDGEPDYTPEPPEGSNLDNEAPMREPGED